MREYELNLLKLAVEEIKKNGCTGICYTQDFYTPTVFCDSKADRQNYKKVFEFENKKCGYCVLKEKGVI